MIPNSELSEAYEDLIKEAIILNSNIEAEEDDTILFENVDYVKTFTELNEKDGLYTPNKGIAIRLNNGTEIYLAINVFESNEEE